jgi:hypothetical protein
MAVLLRRETGSLVWVRAHNVGCDALGTDGRQLALVKVASPEK